jgi:hypothetical protein
MRRGFASASFIGERLSRSRNAWTGLTPRVCSARGEGASILGGLGTLAESCKPRRSVSAHRFREREKIAAPHAAPVCSSFYHVRLSQRRTSKRISSCMEPILSVVAMPSRRMATKARLVLLDSMIFPKSQPLVEHPRTDFHVSSQNTQILLPSGSRK